MHKGWTVTIVAVQVGAVKIYVAAAAVKALSKKEREDKTQLPPKWLYGFSPRHLNA
jgi:hypothetical protein